MNEEEEKLLRLIKSVNALNKYAKKRQRQAARQGDSDGSAVGLPPVMPHNRYVAPPPETPKPQHPKYLPQTEGGEDQEGGLRFLYRLHPSVEARMAVVVDKSPLTPADEDLEVDSDYESGPDDEDSWMK